MLNHNNIDIDIVKQMACGSEDRRPDEDDIIEYFSRMEYFCSNINIFWDDLMKVWRWDCDISKEY